MAEWQPIETAPKDGRILGWCVFPAGAEVRIVHWIPDYYKGAWFAYGVPQEMTHWMPLPAPPQRPADHSGSAG